jgi:hypothetical protein
MMHQIDLPFFIVYPSNLVGQGMAESKFPPISSISCHCASSPLMLLLGVAGRAASGVAVDGGQRRWQWQPSLLSLSGLVVAA